MTDKVTTDALPAPAPEDIIKQEAETAGPTPPPAAMVEPEDPKLPSTAQYTKAELDSAKAEIELLTPDQWIEMVQYIRSLEDNTMLGEAPGIAWTTLYGAQGGQMNVTCRAVTSIIASDNMFATVRHIMKTQPNMNWTPVKSYGKAPVQQKATPQPSAQVATPAPTQPTQASAPPEPVYAPVEGSGVERFSVQSVQHAISKNGHHYVLVKTVESAFGKFGVNAWKETVVGVDFEQWEVGVEYQPPANMKFCLVDVSKKPNKVTAFTDS